MSSEIRSSDQSPIKALTFHQQKIEYSTSDQKINICQTFSDLFLEKRKF